MRICLVTIMFIGLIRNVWALTANSPADPLAIMRAVEHRDLGNDFVAEVDMVLSEANTADSVRSFTWWQRHQGSDKWDLIKFSKPLRLKDTGLLSVAEGGQTMQWLYLSNAAKKEPRKIAPQSKGGRFLGSQFYYVDFETLKADDFEHLYLRAEPLDQWQTHVIESKPKDTSYTYDRFISWIDQESGTPVRIQFYQKNALHKTLMVKSLERIQGIWTTSKLGICEESSRNCTSLEFKNIKYNQGLDPQMFSQNSLVVR